MHTTTNNDHIWKIWKRTETPEIEALARQLSDEVSALAGRSEEADDHDYVLDLSEISFLAFKAGYEARGGLE